MGFWISYKFNAWWLRSPMSKSAQSWWYPMSGVLVVMTFASSLNEALSCVVNMTLFSRSRISDPRSTSRANRESNWPRYSIIESSGPWMHIRTLVLTVQISFVSFWKNFCWSRSNIANGVSADETLMIFLTAGLKHFRRSIRALAVRRLWSSISPGSASAAGAS